MKEIAILVSDHSLAGSVTGPQDLFNVANRVWHYIEGAEAEPLFRIRLVSIDGKAIKTAAGIIIQPDLKLADLEYCDFLLLAAVNYDRESELFPIIESLQAINPHLYRLHASGTLIGASCSATFLLANSGLLKGSIGTTSWWLARLFRTHFPQVKLELNELVVEQNNLWTGGATTSYLTLCLKVVEVLVGQQIANQVAKVLLMDTNRLSQIPYMSLRSVAKHRDKAIARCEDWIQSNLASAITLEELSSFCAMSKRNFIRRFKKAVGETPANYIQQLRVEAAKRYLETTDWSLDRIIEKVGYEDLSAFRRVFQKLTTLSPASYRNKFTLSA
jgi:transcriptional regulator GlxA family with amidase domain